MKPKIKQLTKILKLKDDLQTEYDKLAKKYGFSFQNKRIKFIDSFKQRNRKLRIPTWKYVVPQSLRHLVSMPFIYMMIIPTVILDAFITVYNWTALPLYGIPPVKRRDFIVYDRKFLDYLNLIQKVHCLYCSYVNGVYAYSVEVAARTERYWCPVKAAKRPVATHGWYNDFADYGNPKEWNQKFNDSEAFKNLRKK